MKNHLLPHRADDLERSGLSYETITQPGLRSGKSEGVRAILAFDAGPGLVIPYPTADNQPYYRVKLNLLLLINGKSVKYLSRKGVAIRTYLNLFAVDLKNQHRHFSPVDNTTENRNIYRSTRQ